MKKTKKSMVLLTLLSFSMSTTSLCAMDDIEDEQHTAPRQTVPPTRDGDGVADRTPQRGNFSFLVKGALFASSIGFLARGGFSWPPEDPRFTTLGLGILVPLGLHTLRDWFNTPSALKAAGENDLVNDEEEHAGAEKREVDPVNDEEEHAGAEKRAVDPVNDEEEDVESGKRVAMRTPCFAVVFNMELPEGVNLYSDMGWSDLREAVGKFYKTIGVNPGPHSPILFRAPMGGIAEGDELVIDHRGTGGNTVRLFQPAPTNQYVVLGELEPSPDSFSRQTFIVPFTLNEGVVSYVSFLGKGQDIVSIEFYRNGE